MNKPIIVKKTELISRNFFKIDKFFSKLKNQTTFIKIFENNKIKLIKFNKNEDHFENMFYEIIKNYNKLSFQNYHRQRISNQIKLINTLSSIK